MSLIKIITQDGKTYGELTVPTGEWAGKQFGLSFNVCDNPICHCSDVAIDLVNINEIPEPSSVTRFYVDSSSREVSKVDADKSQYPLIETLIKNFDEVDWQNLWSVFANSKLKTIENLDPEKTVAKFPMAKEIENEGLLVAYAEIIPYGEKFTLGNSNNLIYIDELYCLRRGCKCDRVSVSFIHTQNNKQISENVPFVDLSYKTGKVNSSSNGGSTDESALDLWKRFKELNPDILQIFSKRHKLLSKLYSNYLEKHPISPQPITTSNKVGRNDPCPCGSGKKYKKCCSE